MTTANPDMASYRRHCQEIASRKPDIHEAFSIANSICVDLTDFSHRPELTEAERRLVLAAYGVFQEVSADLNKRSLAARAERNA